VQCLTATYRVPPNPWWSSSGRTTVRLLGAGGSVGELENWRTGEVWDRFDIRKTHQLLISKGDDLLEKKGPAESVYYSTCLEDANQKCLAAL